MHFYSNKSFPANTLNHTRWLKLSVTQLHAPQKQTKNPNKSKCVCFICLLAHYNLRTTYSAQTNVFIFFFSTNSSLNAPTFYLHKNDNCARGAVDWMAFEFVDDEVEFIVYVFIWWFWIYKYASNDCVCEWFFFSFFLGASLTAYIFACGRQM